jgi:hypothetical protein
MDDQAQHLSPPGLRRIHNITDRAVWSRADKMDVYDDLIDLDPVDYEIELEGLAARIGVAVETIKKAVRERRRARGEAAPADDGREVVANANDHETALAGAREALLKANAADPFVFRSRVAEYPVTMDRTRTQPEELDRAELRVSVIGAVAMFRGRRGTVPPPPAVCSMLFNDRRMSLPELRAVTRVPVVRPDGEVIYEGYDPKSKLYVNAWSRGKACADPVAAIMEALEGFAFSDAYGGVEVLDRRSGEKDADGWLLPNPERGKSSRANAVADLVTMVARPLIDGPCPLFLVNKHVRGSGAGYYLSLKFTVAEGTTEYPSNTLSESEEEIGKEIVAALRTGRPFVVFDNVEKIASKKFAGAVTSGRLQARILGTSIEVEIDTSGNVFTAAGNRVKMTPELRRRVVLIHMDPAVDRPEDDVPVTYYKASGFYKVDYPTYLTERREVILWSVIELVRRWCAAGRPTPSALAMPGFPAWSRVVGGILEHAGIEGLCANRKTYLDGSEDQDSAFEDVEGTAGGGDIREALEALWSARGEALTTMPGLAAIWAVERADDAGGLGALGGAFGFRDLRFDVLGDTVPRSADDLHKMLRVLCADLNGRTFTLGRVSVAVEYKKANDGKAVRLIKRGNAVMAGEAEG